MTVKTARPEKPDVPLSPEQQARADAVDMRCLSLCIGMLERVNGVRQSFLAFLIRESLTCALDIRRELNAGRTAQRTYNSRR